MVRRKSNQRLEPLIVPGPHVLGWCLGLDAQHQSCPGQVVHWAPENTEPTPCTCPCHVKKKSRAGSARRRS